MTPGALCTAESLDSFLGIFTAPIWGNRLLVHKVFLPSENRCPHCRNVLLVIFKIFLKRCDTQKEQETDLWIAGSLPPKELGARNDLRISHVGARSPSSGWALLCGFPGRRCRGQDSKQSSEASNLPRCRPHRIVPSTPSLHQPSSPGSFPGLLPAWIPRPDLG